MVMLLVPVSLWQCYLCTITAPVTVAQPHQYDCCFCGAMLPFGDSAQLDVALPALQYTFPTLAVVMSQMRIKYVT